MVESRAVGMQRQKNEENLIEPATVGKQLKITKDAGERNGFQPRFSYKLITIIFSIHDSSRTCQSHTSSYPCAPFITKNLKKIFRNLRIVYISGTSLLFGDPKDQIHTLDKWVFTKSTVKNCNEKYIG